MGDENVDVVPGSRRPDGTYRKPVRVKKGYVPPEEQQTYDKFKMEKPTGVIGADVAEKGPPKTGAAKKNEKRKKKGDDGAGAAEAPAAAPAAGCCAWRMGMGIGEGGGGSRCLDSCYLFRCLDSATSAVCTLMCWLFPCVPQPLLSRRRR
jgi:hypothetical protein